MRGQLILDASTVNNALKAFIEAEVLKTNCHIHTWGLKDEGIEVSFSVLPVKRAFWRKFIDHMLMPNK